MVAFARVVFLPLHANVCSPTIGSDGMASVGDPGGNTAVLPKIGIHSVNVSRAVFGVRVAAELASTMARKGPGKRGTGTLHGRTEESFSKDRLYSD
jgi:hypothetical protein